jgi:hypothetical protein
MTGRMLRFSPILLAALLVGCGGGSKKPVTVTVTVTGPGTTATAPATTQQPPQQETSFRVYFLRDGKVAPFSRQVPQTQSVAISAIATLLQGPTAREASELHVRSALGSASGWTAVLSGAVLTVSGFAGLSHDALAQLVYTLTQFPSVHTVSLDGKSYTRADFEDVTPAILVESPLPFQQVSSPLRVTGTANTFEATFQYELTGSSGKVLSQDFVTATSGSGTRGTFDFTVPFQGTGAAKLLVFERSAADGSRIHQVEIPLSLR